MSDQKPTFGPHATPSQTLQRQFSQRRPNGGPRTRLDWLASIHDWRSEHRRALAKIARIQAMLLHLDADLEESFHELFEHFDETKANLADTSPIADQREEGLIRAFDVAVRQQAEAIETFDALIARLETIKDEITEALAEPASAPSLVNDVEDEVDEAAWESFPASDPPSFNPGRA